MLQFNIYNYFDNVLTGTCVPLKEIIFEIFVLVLQNATECYLMRRPLEKYLTQNTLKNRNSADSMRIFPFQ